MTALSTEAERILAENRRREAAIDSNRYSAADPAELLARQERVRVAVRLLTKQGLLPRAGDPVLEIGYGRMGWLPDLLAWGLRSEDLHGIELDVDRAAVAQQALPGADLRVGDASALPWPDGGFKMVVLSTVMTSILDPAMRRAIASEATRVLAPEGAVLWYDFRWNNPRNPHVRGIRAPKIRQLFPESTLRIRTVTLAPPVARPLARHSTWLAETVGRLPALRSHLVAVGSRESRGGPR